MARIRVLFRLSMPNTGSWNGKWSGRDRNYTLVRSIPEQRVRALGIPTSWYHNFGDGWGASVFSTVMKKGERSPKSDGFCGYDWMVDRIIRWGDTECRHEWKPDTHITQQEGEWERCINCQMPRQICAKGIALSGTKAKKENNG